MLPANHQSAPLVTPALVERVEAAMLQMPQAPCPVVHRFGPGIYIREVTLPAGALAIGHAQRFEHVNIMLTGRVLMLQDDGSTRELVAPLFFIGKPGRKIGRVLETTVWQNVYATTETDVDALEAMFLDKSAAWQASDAQRRALQHDERQADRDDFAAVLRESGFSAETVCEQSENADDQTPLPPGSWPLRVADSPIHGRGVFLSSPVDAGQVIAPARIGGMRTPAGRYTNHSAAPNAAMALRPNGDIDLIALRRIEGCRGGDMGEEVTIDYRQALALSGVNCIKEAA